MKLGKGNKSPYEEPYEIVEVINDHNIKVRTKTGYKVIHVSQCKPYKE